MAILANLSKYPMCNRYIVCVYDVFRAEYNNENNLFLRTELIEGHELSDLRLCFLDGVKIPLELVRFIIYSILKGLEYIHSQGIAHRDIKDENVMFNHQFIKIIDFGMACYPIKIGQFVMKFRERVIFYHRKW